MATTSDPNMVQLISIIESGFPEFHHELPPAFREYHQFRDHLYTAHGILLYKPRTVIPTSLCQHVLTVLHLAHQSMTSMTACAETTVFWPSITPAITATRTTCHHCNRMAPSQPNAPSFPPLLSAYPFQCISVDFFPYKGKNHLVVVDRYSNWAIIEQAQLTVHGTFGTFGIPDECATDGGPEFTRSATCQFKKNWG